MASTKQQKMILLNMARAWIALAKQVDRYQALLRWQGLAASTRLETGGYNVVVETSVSSVAAQNPLASLLDARWGGGVGLCHEAERQV
jgi:hypothetical protein